ncbi:MAG: acetate kinase [Clostridia bacterium]|nr:acetate kinase [Clostridia bacterium]
MKVLVINAGSSSLKYQLIDMETEKAIAKGGCERIGLDKSLLTHKANGKVIEIQKDMPDHTTAIKLVLDALINEEYGAIKSMDEIDAVGHRVVHSAEDFKSSVVITDEVIKTCIANTELAPLHQPANVTGITACKEVMPNTPMVAVFDTAFHSTMPEKAYVYGIPYDMYTKYKIRRYGFHGTSHRYVSDEAAKYLGKDKKDLKIVTLHLGNGSSITAVDGGKSVDTSMSFTPLGGVPMGTRAGDLDPAISEFMAKKLGVSLEEVGTILNKQSGVKGISGVSSDFRGLSAASKQGNHRAELALQIFAYSCKKYIGAYACAMGGLDCIVFTAGIGENDAAMRERIFSDLEFLGVEVDREQNKVRVDGVNEISTKDSKVKVLVIPTNEELVIARDTAELVG